MFNLNIKQVLRFHLSKSSNCFWNQKKRLDTYILKLSLFLRYKIFLKN